MKTTVRLPASLRSHLALLLAVGLLPAATAVGCGGEDAGTGDESNLKADDLADPFIDLVLAGGCTVVDEESGKSVKTAGEGGECPTKVTGVLDKVEATAKKPGNVFVVSERGDVPGPETSYRFVIAQGSETTAPDQLFFSALGSGEGVSQTFLEVMAFDRKKGAYNYYALKGGKWRFMGDGTMVEPGKPAAFECANCHTSGGPLMKELQDSWNNWNSTWFSMPDPKSGDATFDRLFSKKQRADDLEDHVIAGIKAHTETRVERSLKGGALKGLIRQVMCEVAEPNLIATHSKSSVRFGTVQAPSFMFFPPSILASQLFKAPRTGSGRQNGYGDLVGMQLPALDNLQFSGTSYSKAVAEIGQKIGGEPGDAMFALFFPERGFADNMVAEALLRRGLIDKDMMADVLMTDFTVPAYSKVRCDLADTAPEEGANAEEIKAAWIANLEGSSLPGAAELAARFADAADMAAHQKAVNDYLTACGARNGSEPDAYALDIVKLASQRRKEFAEQYGALIESQDLIPTDALTDTVPHALRLSPTTCKLESQELPLGGGTGGGSTSGDSSSSSSSTSSGSGGTGGGGPGCAHDECAAGVALDAACSTCAADVCAADSFCCTNEWDSQCVNQAKMLCSKCQ